MFKPQTKLGVGGLEMGPLERQLVLEVLDSGRLSPGPFVARFEQEIARLHGRRFGVMCNSGTSALQIALAALREAGGWADGDEVLVPAVTFIATANVVLMNGLRPVFVDVDPLTYTIDPALIEARITPRTRAIIPVHLFGLPCDMDPIMALAARHGLQVIEDSAEAMFVRYDGRPVGSFGAMACFSTYVAHLVVTGVGGVTVTDDPGHYEVLRSLVSHGRQASYVTIDDDREADPDKLFQIVDSRFSFVRLGYSFRVTELEGALGVAQLSHKDEMMRRRRENAEFLTRALAPLRDCLQLPTVPDGRQHAFMMYPLLISDRRVARDRLVKFLETNLIETRYMFPLLSQPVYRRLVGDWEGEYPVARRIDRDGFYIGCHPGLGEEALAYVAGKFKEFFDACDWRSTHAG